MKQRVFAKAVISGAVLVLLCRLGVVYTQARLEIRAVETVTPTNEQFLTHDENHKPVTVAGELRVPGQDPRYSRGTSVPAGSGKWPAVVLIHGSGGILPYHERWVQELNDLGIATLLVDSFSSRGITNTANDQSQLSSLAMMIDAYRALGIFAKDPRIHVDRIAVMGFSKGAIASVYSASERFVAMYSPPNVRFAAHIGLYTPCYYHFRDDDQVTGKPIRLFHGLADDYVPIEPCRDYVARLKTNGADATITAYPGAHHLYDNSLLGPPVMDPQAQTLRNCRLVEDQAGIIRNSRTGEHFTFDDACVVRGASRGYDETAALSTTQAVKDFLRSAFALKG